MGNNVLIKNSLVIYLILLFAVASFSADEKAIKEISTIKQLLTERTNGNDAFYSKALSPAQSLQIDKSKSERILIANETILNEMTSVLTTFKSTSDDAKLEAVYKTVNQIETEVVKNGGAYISFFDSVPSAVVARTLLMIPKSTHPDLTTTKVMNALTSYKHSPKPSDHVFEYETAQNLTLGQIQHYVGDDSSVKLAPFQIGKEVVLKKCRKLLGWRCVTSLYRADDLLKDDDSVKVLFISVYDLENNPDHADFSNDKRSINQVTGSTGIYFVKESTNWILLYGVDTQWNNGKLSFQGAIQTEFKKDFERLKESISNDLGISADQIK